MTEIKNLTGITIACDAIAVIIYVDVHAAMSQSPPRGTMPALSASRPERLGRNINSMLSGTLIAVGL